MKMSRLMRSDNSDVTTKMASPLLSPLKPLTWKKATTFRFNAAVLDPPSPPSSVITLLAFVAICLLCVNNFMRSFFCPGDFDGDDTAFGFFGVLFLPLTMLMVADSGRNVLQQPQTRMTQK